MGSEVTAVQLQLPEEHHVDDVTVLVTCSCGEVIESHAESAVLDAWQHHAECRERTEQLTLPI